MKSCLLFYMDVKQFLTLKKEYRLTVFADRVLRKILGPERKYHGDRNGCIMRNFATQR